MSLPAEVTKRVGARRVKRVVYDAETIRGRVDELGAAITKAYPDGDLLLVGLLKGSFIFLADLARVIERPLQVDFIRVSSYGTGREPSGRHRPGSSRSSGRGAPQASAYVPCWTSSWPMRSRKRGSSASKRRRSFWSAMGWTMRRISGIFRLSRNWIEWLNGYPPVLPALTGGA